MQALAQLARRRQGRGGGRRRPRGRRESPIADAPDRAQLAAATLLIALCALPLLPELQRQVGAFVAGALVLRALAIRWPRWRPGMLVLGLLTVVGGANVLDAYHSIWGRNAGTALLLSMLTLKLLEVRTKRDLRVLLLVFCFVLVVQCLFDDSPWRLALLAALLVAGFALLRDLGLPASAPRTRVRILQGLRTTAVMAAQALPLALVLFVFFPRLAAPLWDLGLDNPNAITGLKDWLEPGSVTDLVISGEDVMRVHFDRPPPIIVDRMYWRGPVLWHARGNRFVPARPGDFPEAAVDVEPVSEPLGYTVLLEPTEQRWITALDGPLAAPRGAKLTPDLQLLADRPIDERRFFRLSSALSYRAAGLTLEEEAAATQLPEDKVTPRMRALVASWTAGGPPAETLVERALDYFHEQPFRYTLLPPRLGDKAMDDFLFEARAGYCEHYAAAFTLLMRSAGIPTRIVLGYLGGERNPYSDDYIVRQSEAHAWTEVWLQDKGWTRVDPTAAVAAERIDPEGEFGRLGNRAPARFRVDAGSPVGRLLHDLHLAADAFDAAWQQWIVGFSRWQQQRMLAELGLGRFADLGLVALMALAGAAVMLGWGLWLARPRRATDPVAAAYADFQRRLRRMDAALAKRPGEGPLDHQTRLAAARPDLAEGAGAVVDAYVRLRYAPDDAGEAGLAGLRRAIRRLRPAPMRPRQ